MRLRDVWWLALVACHVTSQSEITRPGKIDRVASQQGAIARKPTLVITSAGRLRFVEPLECPTEEVITEQRATEIETRPNLATFIIGVIATAAGGIMLVRGTSDDEPGSSPFTYAGAAGLAVGLPFAIGPWIGNGSELRPAGPETTRRQPGPSQPCGERALVATHATLVMRGIEVFGKVDGDGNFAVSPYQLLDAYEAASAPAWDITARVDTPAGPRTVDVMLEGRAVAEHAAGFLARSDFDAKVETMRLVPSIVPGTLRVSLTRTADGDHARIVLSVKNDGPGATYGLRGHVSAQGTPAIDGRVVYFGHVAKGGTLTRELLVPITAKSADALRNATVDIALELRDAHGTAPATPIRFRGPILVDAPR